jgi:CAAX protease family protein
MESGKPGYGLTGREAPQSPPAKDLNWVFHNLRGLRAGWRLLVYLLIVVCGGAVVMIGLRVLLPRAHGMPSAMNLLIQEAVGFALVYGAAWIMSALEKRDVGEYGLPASEAVGGKFWLGFLFGFLEVSVLIGSIAAFGGYSFGSLALQGSEIFRWGLFHLLLFFFVGLFEEFLFRGYTQYTLAEGIGFWPAAILLSVLFGGVHLGNPGEGWVGAAGVVLVAIFFCFTLKRTGNLWYAVGLHASFDWGETYLFSVPNSGAVLQGSLSHSSLHGPKWLTGGTVGPEGSIFCFLTMGLQFLVVLWLFPKKDETETRALN